MPGIFYLELLEVVQSSLRSRFLQVSVHLCHRCCFHLSSNPLQCDHSLCFRYVTRSLFRSTCAIGTQTATPSTLAAVG